MDFFLSNAFHIRYWSYGLLSCFVCLCFFSERRHSKQMIDKFDILNILDIPRQDAEFLAAS